MRSHFNLKNSSEPEGISRFADLLVSMTASVQQEIVACDFVSCLPKGRETYDDAFLEKSHLKRRVYSRYANAHASQFLLSPTFRSYQCSFKGCF